MVEVAAADGAETVDVGSASSELAIGQALGDGTDLMDNEQQATAGAQQPPAMVASPGDETAEVDIADLPPDSEAPVVDPSDEST